MPLFRKDNSEQPPVQSGTGTASDASEDFGSKQLGQILIELGEISANHLDEALQIQKSKGGFLGQILIDLKYVEQETVVSSLVKQCKIPHLSLLDYEITKEVLQILPQEVCLKYHLLPIDKMGRILTVAMVNPLDQTALDEIRKLCPDLRIKPILCDWQHFKLVSARVYGIAPDKDSQFDIATFGPGVKGKSNPPKAPASPPPQDEHLQEALDQAVQQVIAETAPSKAADAKDSASEEPATTGRETESEAVSRVTRQNLEKVDTERARREKSATAEAFSKTRRQVEFAVDNPDLLVEGDERVLAGLQSDQLSADFQLEEYLPGSINAFTFKLCDSIATRPGSDYNPFFLYGDVGLGKTHLICGMGNKLIRRPATRVGYASGSRFSERVSAAIQERALDLFRESCCHWDVLILDDIQFLGGKIEAQEELFHVFNVLQEEGRQIIIAGNKSPDRLGMLEQRLVSRFAGGIVATVKPPEFETRLEILRRHLTQKKGKLPDELLSLVAMRVPSDVRKMIGALRKILAYAELVGEAVSCEKAEEILSHLSTEDAA